MRAAGSLPAESAAAFDTLAPVLARAGYMMGECAAGWSTDETAAWEGFVEVGRRVRRDVEALVDERHHLSLSMLGMMGRLARVPNRTLRQTDLADAMGLSLSRTSRIVDILEERDLIVRHRCPSDARAINIELTRTGRARVTAAQKTVHGFVREHFHDRLEPTEIATLSTVFQRLLGDDPSAALGCEG